IDNNPVGGTLTGNAPVNAVNGVATFPNLKIDKVGTGYTLKTTSGTLTPATSNAFDITATPLHSSTLVTFYVQPSNTQVAVSISPAVTLTTRHAPRTTLSTYTTLFRSIDNNPVGGTLTGNAPVNAVNGVATFANLTIDKVGTGYTLTATSGTLTQATSNA